MEKKKILSVSCNNLSQSLIKTERETMGIKNIVECVTI